MFSIWACGWFHVVPDISSYLETWPHDERRRWGGVSGGWGGWGLGVGTVPVRDLTLLEPHLPFLRLMSRAPSPDHHQLHGTSSHQSTSTEGEGFVLNSREGVGRPGGGFQGGGKVVSLCGVNSRATAQQTTAAAGHPLYRPPVSGNPTGPVPESPCQSCHGCHTGRSACLEVTATKRNRSKPPLS